MKAIILAAGFGTRLLPYSRLRPKPLFTLNRRPVLDLTVARLQQAGFDTIMINTHYGHDPIERFICAQPYHAAVTVRHEPEILGTGGAIGNIADWWNRGPLLVINADIVTDIDPAAVLAFHHRHRFPVTLVMHHHERFNSVVVDPEGFVRAFPAAGSDAPDGRIMAFTGIHVIDPRVLDFIRRPGPADIIDVYRSMLLAGERIKVQEMQGHYWQDIGTPQSYRAAALDFMTPLAFEKAFGEPAGPVDCTALAGDGSDRRWYRQRAADHSLILVDHGIRNEQEDQHEVDAFVAIGRHLHTRGAAVPRIYLHDGFSGLVFLEDLGDRHLQDAVGGLDRSGIGRLYRQVIDQWIQMALDGYDHFDPAWTWQTQAYDRGVILEKECRYFVEAFARGYLGLDLTFGDLAAEFNTLADVILTHGVTGFMHRDLQSRNIMLKDGRPFFIDFQGGRSGPLQYDLAALLIDPYVGLPQDLQDELCRYAVQTICGRLGIQAERFMQGYRGCVLGRNLQILGAFAYLSRVKGKPGFENHIPAAVRTLQHRLALPAGLHLPGLASVVAAIARRMGTK